jgi:hypothetical protein
MFQSPPPSMRKMMVTSPAALEAMDKKDAAVSDYYQSKLTASPKNEAAFEKYAVWKSRHEAAQTVVLGVGGGGGGGSSVSSGSSPKSKASSTGTAAPLDVLLDGLTNKVVIMLLDMSCHLVEQVEDSLDDDDYDTTPDDDDDDTTDTTKTKSTDSQLVNALRGYLLTLRFDIPSSKRATSKNAPNHRTSAIARLTTLLEQQLQRSSLRLRQETMRAALKGMEDISELIQSEWEEYSKDCCLMLLAADEEEECKENTKETAISSSSSPRKLLLDADRLAILEIAGVSPPPSNTHDDHTGDDDDIEDTRQVGSQLIGNQLLNLLKIAFTEKVKHFPTFLSHAMDTILCDYALSKFVPPTTTTTGGKSSSSSPVKPATDQMATILDAQYQRLVKAVRTEIGSIMNVCDGLMLVKKTKKEDYVGTSMGFGSGFGSSPKGTMRGGKFI